MRLSDDFDDVIANMNDQQVESVISGGGQSPEKMADVETFIGELRSLYANNAAPPVSTVVGEFVGVTPDDIATVHIPAVPAPVGGGRKKRSLALTGGIIGTIGGKLLLGAAVAAASVGAAHAAGVADVPLLPDAADTSPAVDVSNPPDSIIAPPAAAPDTVPGPAVDVSDPPNSINAAVGAAVDVSDPSDSIDPPATGPADEAARGQAIAATARPGELSASGCEHGKAVAELATANAVGDATGPTCEVDEPGQPDPTRPATPTPDRSPVADAATAGDPQTDGATFGHDVAAAATDSTPAVVPDRPQPVRPPRADPQGPPAETPPPVDTPAAADPAVPSEIPPPAPVTGPPAQIPPAPVVPLDVERPALPQRP